ARLLVGDSDQQAHAHAESAAARGGRARRHGAARRGPQTVRTMKASIRNKLEKLAERHEEVSALLADPQIIAATDRFRELSMEYSRLEPVVSRYRAYHG